MSLSPVPSIPRPKPDLARLRDDFDAVRARTLRLSEPLTPEDCAIQSMPDVSPTKWHLAHTTWFFETFVLRGHLAGYEPLHPEFNYLFNSYYQTVGSQYPRPQRGLISRPGLDQVLAYRREIEVRVRVLLDRADAAKLDEIAPLIELGLQHEQQHQELLLMDIKHVFSCNPLHPAYGGRALETAGRTSPLRWIEGRSGLCDVGHDGEGFCFDNETPRHRVHVGPHRLASRLVTCGEFRAFMDDDGYMRPELWLADGWSQVQASGWRAPGYWFHEEGAWHLLTLSGRREVADSEPVCHVSYYEADAFARWAGKRLPTEAEWELTAVNAPVRGNFVEDQRLHPAAATQARGAQQLFGDLWEWTQTPYVPYPGFRPLGGSIGEYNGKFMANQYVLRGGSCVSPRDHVRATYRNFYYPHQRWQFAGIRLAEDA